MTSKSESKVFQLGIGPVIASVGFEPPSHQVGSNLIHLQTIMLSKSQEKDMNFALIVGPLFIGLRTTFYSD